MSNDFNNVKGFISSTTIINACIFITVFNDGIKKEMLFNAQGKLLWEKIV
jgi:hypothetical protein